MNYSGPHSRIALMSNYGKRFISSTWLFPLVLTIILLLLTALRINGSSVGIYHTFFYGPVKDPSLLVNHPQLIRSDEFVVNTQVTVAQKANNYSPVNHNIGNGENMSVVLDVPYKEWSEIFKPQNWSFFVLPIDQAFAFKWWFLSYLLLISCYFFTLSILPGRRLLAVLLAFSLLFSAFVQWWYQFGTLSCLYYGLFSMTFFVNLMRSRHLRWAIGWGMLLAYTLVGLALVLYPPFQIPCALVAGTFSIGYLLNMRTDRSAPFFLKKSIIIIGSCVVAVGIVGIFLLTRYPVIHTIETTAYPGQRLTASGGFNFAHTFSGFLGFQFQSAKLARYYQIPSNGLTNQSESSNFILLAPFLFLPSLYMIFHNYRRREAADWPLILINMLFLVFMAWLFIPHLTILGKLFLLDRVPQARLLIGLGLLNIVQLVLFIRHFQNYKDDRRHEIGMLIYACVIFSVELLLGLHAMQHFPGFIGKYRVVCFALPVPIIVYLILQKRFVLAALGLAGFSIFTSFHINPLYRGTEVITNTPLSVAIKTNNQKSPGRWAVEPVFLENFPAMNGAQSLSGVYAYPQLKLWEPIGSKREQFVYNRYAHVTFNFARDSMQTTPTKLELVGADHFSITTEPCSHFLKTDNVKYLIAAAPLSPGNKCTMLLQTVSYPAQTLYIYRIN